MEGKFSEALETSLSLCQVMPPSLQVNIMLSQELGAPLFERRIPPKPLFLPRYAFRLPTLCSLIIQK